MKIRNKVWLEQEGELVFGPGKFRILKAVQETGSINQAAKKMNMSYRHMWSYIRSAEKRLKKPLLQKQRGGKYGGGAVLTDYAKDLIEKFEQLESQTGDFVRKSFENIFKPR